MAVIENVQDFLAAHKSHNEIITGSWTFNANVDMGNNNLRNVRKIGIGVAGEPTHPLEIVNGVISRIIKLKASDSSPFYLGIERAGSKFGLGIFTNADTLAEFQSDGGFSLGSYASANEAPANGIIVAGDSGFGTPSPGEKVDVVGNVKISGNLTDGTVSRSIAEIDSHLAGHSDTVLWSELDLTVSDLADLATKAHTSLAGLGDDDHTQYILVDGSRAFTGNVTIEGSTLTFDGTTNDGVLQWINAADVFQFNDDIVMQSDERVLYRSITTGIYSQATTFLDLFADGAVRIGNSQSGAPTTYLNINPGGDTCWVGEGSGLCFAGISVNTAGTPALGITLAGKANRVQVSQFDTNNNANDMTPDHTNNHITVDRAGKYLCIIGITIDSQVGAAAQFHFSAFKNNGTVEFPNVHRHRNLPGGAGGNGGSLVLLGHIDLAVNDTVEVWGWNPTSTQDVNIVDISHCLTMVGGA